MLGKLAIITLFSCHLAQCQPSNSPSVDVKSLLNVSKGESFSLWCNLTSHQDLSVGFSIRWLRDGDPWCVAAIALQNTTKGECVNRRISINDVYNPSGTQDFQLNIPNATLTDSGNHSCAVVISSTAVAIRPNTFTLVFVSVGHSNFFTTAEADSQTTATTSTSHIPSTPTATTKSPHVQSTKPSSTDGLSKETIIAIGAGGGGGVLLVTIIVAVVCVKKKGKGNSTSDIDERKSTYRKSNSFEKNAENMYTDDKRKSNPLDKNVENLHYADLTLHDNPKSPSSKGTGSAKSKALTLNPSDERVEYAAVMAS